MVIMAATNSVMKHPTAKIFFGVMLFYIANTYRTVNFRSEKKYIKSSFRVMKLRIKSFKWDFHTTLILILPWQKCTRFFITNLLNHATSNLEVSVRIYFHSTITVNCSNKYLKNYSWIKLSPFNIHTGTHFPIVTLHIRSYKWLINKQLILNWLTQ